MNNYTTDEQQTSAQVAIFAAAEAGDAGTARGLLQSDPALASARDERGNMPLHLAALAGFRPKGGHVDVARLLLEHGADIHAAGHEDNIGMATPLIMAAFAGMANTGMVRLLLEHGGDPNDVSTHGVTALSTAAEHGEDAICNALLAGGAQADIHIAASLGWTDEVLRLLGEKPSLLNATDRYRGATALYFAAQRDREDTARALLDAGADVNAVSTAGNTALHVAAAASATGTAALLISRGAHVNTRNARGQTPLHWAMEEWWLDSSEALRLLLRHGADAGARDDARRTPRDIARRYGKMHLVDILDSRCRV